MIEIFNGFANKLTIVREGYMKDQLQEVSLTEELTYLKAEIEKLPSKYVSLESLPKELLESHVAPFLQKVIKTADGKYYTSLGALQSTSRYFSGETGEKILNEYKCLPKTKRYLKATGDFFYTVMKSQYNECRNDDPVSACMTLLINSIFCSFFPPACVVAVIFGVARDAVDGCKNYSIYSQRKSVEQYLRYTNESLPAEEEQADEIPIDINPSVAER